jgi:hypothetical protein
VGSRAPPQFPQYEFPQYEFPQYEFPQYEFPQYEFPQYKLPQYAFRFEWAQQDSNLRPHGCEPCALTN